MRDESLYGSGRSTTAFTMLKMAVFAPMPRASVRAATAVKPGFFRSMRKAKRRSWKNVSRRGSPRRDRDHAGLCERGRRVGRRTRAVASCGFLSRRQEARQDFRGLLPFSRFPLELLATGARQLVVLGFAIVIRCTPFGGNVAFLLQL